MTRVIKIYKNFFSPFLHSISGSSYSGCRFYPTCSEYTDEAIIQYGVLKGFWLGLKRVLKCNPLFEGGLDLLRTDK